MFISDQYDVRELIGEGGMGKVYKAYDRKLRTFVAIKTVVGVLDPDSLKLFRKECNVLTSLCHPNIVDIKAIGEFEEASEKKPFFVMPYLSGMPLGRLIREPDLSHRLTVETTVDIFEHVCRALQSAHDKGIIHRDIKPSNIFVMDDNSVKVIDFGIALMVDARSTIEQGGTPLYMSPEQLAYEPLTRATDIFSLGVVCYEALTRRHPFKGAAEGIREAILHGVPPAASSINGSVSFALSQVVHKAMAKSPKYRFSSADELRGMLQKAMRNEPVQMFDVSRIRPRIERARKAYEKGDLAYASEMLDELEAEGHLDSEISSLQDQINRSKRQKRIQQLLESARARMEQQEYSLAMQKVQEVLDIDRENASALGLKSTIMELNTSRSVDEWLRLAQHHLANRSYKHAIQALQDVLKHRPRDEQALELLAEVSRSEREYLKRRAEKEKAYEAARAAWQNGEISTALSRMQTVVDLDQQAPDPTSHERAVLYQQFYNQVRSEHDLLKSAYDEAARQLQAGEFKIALERCGEFLLKYPNYAPLQMLRFDIEERERQALSKYIAEIDRMVEAEPDLDKRIAILKEAAVKYPAEAHFTSHLKLLERKRELVRGIIAKARLLAEREQFAEAKAQWESLRTVYPQYPALDLEIERIERKRDQQRRAEEKAHWLQQINDQLESGEYTASLETLRKMKSEFAREPEFQELERRAEHGLERFPEIETLRSSGRRLVAERQYEDGLRALWAAYRLDERNRISKGDVASALLEYANVLMHSDARASRSLIEEAIRIDPANAWAKSLAASLVEQEAREPPTGDRRPHGSETAAPSLIRDETPLLSLPPGPPTAPKSADRIPSRVPGDDYVPPKPSGTEARPSVAAAGGVARRWTESVPLSTVLFRTCESAFFAATELVQARGASVWHGLAGVSHFAWFPHAAESVKKSRYHPYPILAAVFVVFVTVISALIVIGTRGKHASALPRSITELRITTSPTGAIILVNGKPRGIAPCTVRLAKDVYQVLAVKPGYADAGQPFTIQQGEQQAALALTLQPLLASLRVVAAGLKDGTLQLDGGPPQPFKDGEFATASLVGLHVLTVASTAAGGTAMIRFDAEPGSIPIVEPPDPGPFETVAVASVGGQVRLVSAPNSLEATLDAEKLKLTSTAIERANLSYSTHVLILGRVPVPEHFDIASAPALAIFLLSTHASGTLTVNATGVSDGEIYIDGSPRGPTGSGQTKLPLPPGTHQVTVQKDGYTGACNPATVQIQLRVPASVNCELRRFPQWASLLIQGVPQGAKVVIDGKSLGVVEPDGSFSSSRIAPGRHLIEIRAHGYDSKPVYETVAAGATGKMRASDFRVEELPGVLTVLTSPPTETITVSPDDETSEKEVRGGITTLHLKPGTHKVTVAWPSGLTRSESVAIAAGTPTPKRFLLPPAGMEAWGKDIWQRDGSWFRHSGKGLVLFNITPTYGTFEFAFTLPEGNMRWVLNYVDERNYDLFEISHGFFFRTRIVNGKKTKWPRKPYPAASGPSAVLRINVTPGSVKQELVGSGKPVLVDTWNDKSGNFAKGKFGFLPRANDVVEISGFKFQPD